MDREQARRDAQARQARERRQQEKDAYTKMDAVDLLTLANAGSKLAGAELGKRMTSDSRDAFKAAFAAQIGMYAGLYAIDPADPPAHLHIESPPIGVSWTPPAGGTRIDSNGAVTHIGPGDGLEAILKHIRNSPDPRQAARTWLTRITQEIAEVIDDAGG